jgi:hypothetical protein
MATHNKENMSIKRPRNYPVDLVTPPTISESPVKKLKRTTVKAVTEVSTAAPRTTRSTTLRPHTATSINVSSASVPAKDIRLPLKQAVESNPTPVKVPISRAALSATPIGGSKELSIRSVFDQTFDADTVKEWKRATTQAGTTAKKYDYKEMTAQQAQSIKTLKELLKQVIEKKDSFSLKVQICY